MTLYLAGMAVLGWRIVTAVLAERKEARMALDDSTDRE